MGLVTLYCDETKGLKLGPGSADAAEAGKSPEVIVFQDGFATFDEKEYPDWQEWIHAPGTPFIRVASDGEAPSGVECPICHRYFKTQFALNSHINTHNPNREAVQRGK